jgi:hypothetical protein
VELGAGHEIIESAFGSIWGEHDVQRAEIGHQVKRVITRPILNRVPGEPSPTGVRCQQPGLEFVKR